MIIRLTYCPAIGVVVASQKGVERNETRHGRPFDPALTLGARIGVQSIGTHPGGSGG